MNELLGPLVLFAAAMTLTPGPNVVLVTASAANFGFRRTIRRCWASPSASAPWSLATGLGFAGVVHAEPRLHTVLKYRRRGLSPLSRLAHRPSRRRQRLGARPTDRLRRSDAVHLDEPQGVGVGARGGRGLHHRGRQTFCGKASVIAAVLAAFCLLSAGDVGRLRDGDRPLPRRPRARACLQLSMAGLLALSLIPVFW